MNLNYWVKLRTFHHHQFSNLSSLVQQKKSRNLSVSLCLPTLNESKTIGRIIKVLKRHLMEKNPLVDEILVIDSGSADGTVEIARKTGIDVYDADDILREAGPGRGKGENLWKSLLVAKGDIIVWLDTDIENMHPRFVYGLLGPLLFQEEIGYVKGFYRRPLHVGKKLAPVGGGRVTELMVKPFFNMMFPNLTVFQQPLSGEYAGRREILERVPFFTGYGVETGLLIDVESRFGLARMAQVDLDVRVHRNQDLSALKRMAFGILRVLFSRAEQQGKVILMENLKTQLLDLQSSDDHHYEIVSKEITENERPPMILMERYQRIRELQDDDLVLIREIQTRRISNWKSLGPYLDKNLIMLEGKKRNKRAVLEEISNVLFSRGLTEDSEELLRQFLIRESSLSTGIGEGIAIPHAIYEGVKDIRLLIYRNKTGIFFNSLDAEPVKLVFAVIAPASRRERYLEILSGLANIVKDARIRELLMNAGSAAEICEILRKAEIMSRFERELRLIES